MGTNIYMDLFVTNSILYMKRPGVHWLKNIVTIIVYTCTTSKYYKVFIFSFKVVKVHDIKLYFNYVSYLSSINTTKEIKYKNNQATVKIN